MVKSQIMRTSAIKLLIWCLCYFKHLIKQNILKLWLLCIAQVAKGGGYLLAIAVQNKLHLHHICSTAACVPACVEQQPHLPVGSCQHKERENKEGEIPNFNKSNDCETLTQIQTTWKGPSLVSVLQKVMGTGLKQGQLGNNPTNFLSNVPFAPKNITPNS